MYLKSNNIITNDNPWLEETKSRVLFMFMRIDRNTLNNFDVEINQHSSASEQILESNSKPTVFKKKKESTISALNDLLDFVKPEGENNSTDPKERLKQLINSD
jgi:hypothetical protein